MKKQKQGFTQVCIVRVDYKVHRDEMEPPEFLLIQ